MKSKIKGMLGMTGTFHYYMLTYIHIYVLMNPCTHTHIKTSILELEGVLV